MQLFGAVVAALAITSASAASGPVVQLSHGGSIEGYIDGSVAVFQGVPFGKSPIGALRFRPPQPVVPWTGTKNTTALGPECPQFDFWSLLDKKLVEGSEDCLTLDVYVPAAALRDPAGSKLPVMQWIYGGGFGFGDDDASNKYNGAALAHNFNVIVVAGNYRVGMLGFGAFSSLLSEDGTTGNAGVQDQTLAMQWTQDNIALFGGDPSRVLLYGESAGGMSVCFHMVNTASSGLFSSAIMESGSCDAPAFFQTLTERESFTTGYAVAAGCADSGDADTLIECAQGLDVSAIINTPLIPNAGQVNGTYVQPFLPALYPIMPWGPTIDGSDQGLKATPLLLMRSGEYNKVPFAIGTNENEGSVFSWMLGLVLPDTSPDAHVTTADRVRSVVKGWEAGMKAKKGKKEEKMSVLRGSRAAKSDMSLPYPPSAVDVQNGLYEMMAAGPHGDHPNFADVTVFIDAATSAGSFFPTVEAADWANLNTTASFITRYFFACSARRAAAVLAAQGTPVWLYHFEAKVDSIEYDLFGDFHSIEVPFVFGTKEAANTTLSMAMGAAWSSMAATGSPSTKAHPWPQWTAATKENLVWRANIGVENDLWGDVCDFFDANFDVAYSPHAASR